MSIYCSKAIPPNKVRSLIHIGKRYSDALLFGCCGSGGRKNWDLQVIKMGEDVPGISQTTP